MDNFGELTHALVWVNVVVNGFIILLAAVFVLRALQGVVRNVQHHRVIILVGITTPKPVVEKLFAYYRDAIRAMDEIEEGEDAENLGEELEDQPLQASASDHASLSSDASQEGESLRDRGRDTAGTSNRRVAYRSERAVQYAARARVRRPSIMKHSQALTSGHATRLLTRTNHVSETEIPNGQAEPLLLQGALSSSSHILLISPRYEPESSYSKPKSSTLIVRCSSDLSATSECAPLTQSNLLEHIRRSPWSSARSLGDHACDARSQGDHGENVTAAKTASSSTEYHGLSDASSPRETTEGRGQIMEKAIHPPNVAPSEEHPLHEGPQLKPEFRSKAPSPRRPMRRLAESLRKASNNSMTMTIQPSGEIVNIQPQALEVGPSLTGPANRGELSDEEIESDPRRDHLPNEGHFDVSDPGSEPFGYASENGPQDQHDSAHSGRRSMPSASKSSGERSRKHTKARIDADRFDDIEASCEVIAAAHVEVNCKHDHERDATVSHISPDNLRSKVTAEQPQEIHPQRRRSTLVHRSSSSLPPQASPSPEAAAAADLREAQLRMAARVSPSLRQILYAHVPWYSQSRAHVLSLVVMLLLCVLCTVYPSRNLDALVNAPKKANQANRRRFLQMAAVHFTRELVLADGFSRLNSSELAAGLRWALDSLQAADNAARLGGSLGVGAGGDVGINSEEHNHWMYDVRRL